MNYQYAIYFLFEQTKLLKKYFCQNGRPLEFLKQYFLLAELLLYRHSIFFSRF